MTDIILYVVFVSSAGIVFNSESNMTAIDIRYDTWPLRDTFVFWHYSEFLLQLRGPYLLRQDVPAAKDPPLFSHPLPEQDVSGHPASSGLFLC